jgi:hypothetical protein
MLSTLRSKTTYANVVATVALFIALGGSATASVLITSNSQVASNTISGHKPPSGDRPNVIAGSINGQDLASGSVANAKLGANAVTGNKVADNSLTGNDILESSLAAVPNATQASTADSATEATHATTANSATSAESATNAASADQLGGHGQADFGSGILGGAVTPSVAASSTRSFFPIGFTSSAGNSAGFAVPVTATMRDFTVSLSSPVPSGGSLMIKFTNSTTGASRTCEIFTGDSACDAFVNDGGQFGFSPGDVMTGVLSNQTSSAYGGTVSFGYRLTN